MRHSWKVLIKKITPSEKPTIMNVTARISCHRSSTKNIPWSTGLRDKFPKWFECEINQVACRGRAVWRLTVTGLKQMNLTEPTVNWTTVTTPVLQSMDNACRCSLKGYKVYCRRHGDEAARGCGLYINYSLQTGEWTSVVTNCIQSKLSKATKQTSLGL